jgi:hypothetical protein
MNRKEHFACVLDKILVRADYQLGEDQSRHNLFITRSPYILQKLGKNRPLSCINNMAEVYDVKNDIFYVINLDSIDSMEFIGIPFEVYPEYMYLPKLDGKITREEFYNYQEKSIEFIINLGKRLSTRCFENNHLSYDALNKMHTANMICNIVDNDLPNFAYTFSNEDRETIKKIDLRDIEPKMVFLQEELMNKAFDSLESEFPNIFEYIKYVTVCETVKMPLKFLDSEHEENMNKCIVFWKESIAKEANKVLAQIADEKNCLEELEADTNKEEMEYVRTLILNSVNEIDYTVFKTPRQLFHFWPPLLFPIPGFIVHD